MSRKLGPVTPIMRRNLSEIAAYWEREKIAPTADDLAPPLGVHPNTVRRMLDRLERRGLITRRPGAPRTLRLTDAGVTEAHVST